MPDARCQMLPMPPFPMPPYADNISHVYFRATERLHRESVVISSCGSAVLLAILQRRAFNDLFKYTPEVGDAVKAGILGDVRNFSVGALQETLGFLDPNVV